VWQIYQESSSHSVYWFWALPDAGRGGVSTDNDQEDALNSAHVPARRLLSLAVATALSLALLFAAPAGAHGKGHSHQAKSHGHHGKHHGHFRGRGKAFDTMTRNLYLGADLMPAIEAGTPEELGAANGQILREVVHNDFPTRAKGLAEEILTEKPDLVGLQEVALWQTTPLSQAATPIAYDYLAELLAELNKHGKHYEVVVVQEEFDLEAPGDYNGVPNDGPLPGFPNSEMLGRLTMRDVILARHGAGVRTWNEAGGNFATLLEIPILGEPVAIKRGWTATDAKVRGSHPFRFVNTHLEAFQPEIRAAQASELVAPGGPATSELPVVLVGDLNSDDDTVEGLDTLAYNLLLEAGMVERSTDEPLSCCLKASELGEFDGGSVADFDHQVDHIMTRDPGKVALRSSTVTGLLPVNGFWDSDHAGLFSALRFVH
jgi:endonuclease/exonuclease/phosphatase family metal-dependent hydrolase